MAKYQYVLFDLDGTLTDPKEGITKSFQYALNKLDIQEELDNLEKIIGPPLKNSFMEFYKLSEKETLKGIEYYRERFAKKGIYENKLIDGIKEMLQELKEHDFKMAIASSKPTVFIEKICDIFQITPYFDVIIGSYLDGRRSDKQEVIQEAILQLHVDDIKKVMMVGDRKYDVEGAKKNQVCVAGVTFGYGGKKELEEAGADYIVFTVKELLEVLIAD